MTRGRSTRSVKNQMNVEQPEGAFGPANEVWTNVDHKKMIMDHFGAIERSSTSRSSEKEYDENKIAEPGPVIPITLRGLG